MCDNKWVQTSNNGTNLVYTKGDAALYIEVYSAPENSVMRIDGLYALYRKLIIGEILLNNVLVVFEHSGRSITIQPELFSDDAKFIEKLLNEKGDDETIDIHIEFKERIFSKWHEECFTVNVPAVCNLSPGMKLVKLFVENLPMALVKDPRETKRLENRLTRVWNKHFSDGSFSLNFNSLWGDFYHELTSGTKYPITTNLYSRNIEYNGWRVNRIFFKGPFCFTEFIKDHLLMILEIDDAINLYTHTHTHPLSTRKSIDIYPQIIEKMINKKKVKDIYLYVDDKPGYYFHTFGGGSRLLLDKLVHGIDVKDPIDTIFAIEYPNAPNNFVVGSCIFVPDSTSVNTEIRGYETLAQTFDQCFNVDNLKLDHDLFNRMLGTFNI